MSSGQRLGFPVYPLVHVEEERTGVAFVLWSKSPSAALGCREHEIRSSAGPDDGVR